VIVDNPHIPYISRNKNHWPTFCHSQGSIFIEIFLAGSVTQFFFRKSAFWPFRVIQGHWFWYQSKAHMRLPISPP